MSVITFLLMFLVPVVFVVTCIVAAAGLLFSATMVYDAIKKSIHTT